VLPDEELCVIASGRNRNSLPGGAGLACVSSVGDVRDFAAVGLNREEIAIVSRNIRFTPCHGTGETLIFASDQWRSLHD